MNINSTNNIHGHIFCGGVGSRWGGTREVPYPKHLEEVLGMSILELNIRFMQELGISNISVSLNPLLYESYIEHLADIAARLGVSITYALTDFDTKKDYVVETARLLTEQGAVSLEGHKVYIDENQIILGLQGDSVVAGFEDEISGIKSTVESIVPTDGEAIYIGGRPIDHILPMGMGVIFSSEITRISRSEILPLIFKNINEPKDKIALEEFISENREHCEWLLRQVECVPARLEH